MPAHSRLRTVLEDGQLTLPEGGIHVTRPPVTFDMGTLRDRDVSISTGFFPDYEAWRNAGYAVSVEATTATVQVVVLPRSKSLGRAMVEEATRLGDLIVVDGQKTDGVDSVFKDCRKRLGDLSNITKAHGRLFWFDACDAFTDWQAKPPSRNPQGFYTNAGVFSDGEVDGGSALLAAALPTKIKGRVADFGAGWGYLAAEVLKHDAVATLDLIEAEARSLECARLNITDPRAQFHWADATSFKPDAPYDAIVMNPPFHQGRTGDPTLGQAFIRAAHRALGRSGELWMVANRHLPYEQTLNETFRSVTELDGSGGFKLFHATRPIR